MLTTQDIRFTGVFALQEQAGLSIHPGATTTLALLGKANYLELGLKE